MNNLSSSAQAVLNAVCDNTEPDCDTQHLIAAALRAVVQELKYFGITEKNILAIAAELESA
jgi:hypothetical protein